MSTPAIGPGASGGPGADLSGLGWLNQTAPVLGPQARENTYRWATVTATDPDPLRIQLDGDSVELPLTPESLIEAGPPDIGARVWVQLFGRRVIILGVSAPSSDMMAMRAQMEDQQDQLDAQQAQLTAQAGTIAGKLAANRFAFGVATVPASLGFNSVTVTYPSLAGSTFVGFVNPATTLLGALGLQVVGCTNVTATGMTINAYRVISAATPVMWMAVGT